MKPSERYAAEVAKGHLQYDAAQSRVLEALDRLYFALLAPEKPWSFLKPKPQSKGVYLCGSVGGGKTYLMDFFYESLTLPKQRIHFYEFMNHLHAELKLEQGERDPLKKAVSSLAKKIKVLCLDEFFVEDIADAMILSSFLNYFFQAGLVLVTTSNVEPDHLYEEGLQRDRFLSAIQLLKTHLQVLPLVPGQDYRLAKKWCDERYHPSLADQIPYLQYHFNALAAAGLSTASLPLRFVLNGRDIDAHLRGTHLVWIDFGPLCEEARVARDYFLLTQSYSVILVGNIPILSAANDDAARRFISLVDTCYDQKTLLILAAAAPLDQLYQGGQLDFEFARTRSRIFEMSSWVVADCMNQ